MKKDDFPLLNQLCEEFLGNAAPSFVTNNILPLADLCKCLISLSKTIEYDFMEVLNRKNASFKTMMLPEESTRICEEFLDKIHPSLKEQFQTFQKNGVTNLVVVEEENKINDIQTVYYGRQEAHPNVNVGIYYNLTDSPYIIHEFFHGNNWVPINCNRESETHRILSETISVYFEERIVSFLKEMGYPKEELDQLTRVRYIDCFEAAKDLFVELAILDCYQRIGKVSLENYKLMKSLENPKRPLVFKSEEEFIDVCIKAENKLKEGFRPKEMASHVSYVFGVSLAFFLLEQENNTMDEKMITLNEKIKNISSYSNLYENIDSLGVSLNNGFIEKTLNIFKGKMENIESRYQNRKNK